MQSFELHAVLPATPERVWEVFTDHAGYTKWAGVKEVVLRQQGDPPPNGLGAIRVMRAGGIAVEEEITAFDPPKRMEYRLVSGIPVKDYVADVVLEPRDGQTQLTWKVRFNAKIPGTGWLFERLIKRGLGDTLTALAKAVS